MKMLDLSKFEKIAEDQHTTRMRHKDGHEMTILVAKLPKIHREQLKRLKMAKGGVAHYDEGTEAAPVSQYDAGSQPIQPADAMPIQTVPSGFDANPPGVPILNNTATPEGAALTQSKALQMQQQAANEQQAIDVSRAKQSVPLAQEQRENAIAAAKRYDQTISDMKNHTDDFAAYMQGPGKINPNAIFENASAPKKIASAIGLLLGGFSGGLNGTGRNPAMDYLLAQQDKDIAAQRANADQHKTVWGAYNTLYNNENASTELAKKSWADKVAAEANIISNQLGTPEAHARNLKLQGDLMQKGYDSLQKAAFLVNQGGGEAAPSTQAKSIEPGSREKPKFGPDTADGIGVYSIQPILKPEAKKMMANQAARAANGDPVAAAQLSRLQDQYERASKADAVLAQAKDLYRELSENATPGGWTERHVAPESLSGIPVVGEALGALGSYAGDAITGARRAVGMNKDDEFSQNRQYNTAAQKLSDMLRSVYPSIGGGELHSKMSGLLPDQKDTKEDLTKKMKAFEDLIKTSGPFNVIENAGLANKMIP